MIVTCSECTTSFQLDEARIPATGAQVRCSRCKHAFFLEHPSASQTDAVHGIAEAAAADPTATTPPASSDLGGFSSSGLGESNATEDFEEEEWQFSEEVRVEGDDEPAEEDSSGAAGLGGLSDESDESAFGLGADFSEGLDADALSADVGGETAGASTPSVASVDAEAASDAGGGSGLELDGPSEVVAEVRDESSFGSVDDFSSLMEDDEPAGEDLLGDSSAAIESVAAESAGSYAGAGATDDLGDPESWDLVGGAPASAPVHARQSGLRKTASRAASTGQALEGALAELSFSPDEDAVEYEDEREPSALSGALGKFGNAIGWVVTLAALVGVTGLLVGPEISRWADAPQTAHFGTLHAETNETHWVETARSGFLLVIRGEVTNAGSASLEPANVRLWFLDGAGERLTAAPLRVGQPLSEAQLRESAEPNLRRQLAASAAAFRSSPLAPGQSRVFESVVLEAALPGDARRILLEVADPNAETPIAATDPETVPRRLVDATSASGRPLGDGIDPEASASGTQSSTGRISDQLDLKD
ncbi:MAG: zinc-ribbon domain-containing protein [Myxococcota bacterium]